MLENKGWYGILRDGITPSDLDLPYVPVVFGSNGRVMLCDLSSSYRTWGDAPKGQHRLYQELISSRPHVAVLCHHNVVPETGRKIDTLLDIDTFQIMLDDFGWIYSSLYDGTEWEGTVRKWVNEPNGWQEIRRAIIGGSIGMRRRRLVGD